MDGADQFPKRDFTATWAEGCVELMEPVEAMLAEELKPEKAEGTTVVLLDDAPNIDVLLVEAVEAVDAVVRDEGCAKAADAVASPKMGLKFWMGALISEDDVAEEVVVVAGKMGLNPAASSGLVLLTDPELLAGEAATAATGAGEAVT